MRNKLLLFLFLLISISAKAQVGICKKAVSLEDNSFVGSLWEPTGTVNYTESNGQGLYGLVISMNTSDTYLDMEIGNKVSIEYTDSTREIVTIQSSSKSYSNTIISHKVVDIYERNVLVYPKFDDLIHKSLKRIVIQRGNGNVWIIETKPKRAKKLPEEFQKAMNEAQASYKTKVSNNNYFE